MSDEIQQGLGFEIGEVQAGSIYQRTVKGSPLSTGDHTSRTLHDNRACECCTRGGFDCTTIGDAQGPTTAVKRRLI